MPSISVAYRPLFPSYCVDSGQTRVRIETDGTQRGVDRRGGTKTRRASFFRSSVWPLAAVPARMLGRMMALITPREPWWDLFNCDSAAGRSQAA